LSVRARGPNSDAAHRCDYDISLGHRVYFFARFLAFLVAGPFAVLPAFFDFDFFFLGAAVFAEFAAFDVFFLAGFAPFSAFGTETPLNLDRTVFTAVSIGLPPFADESPTIAPAIPLTAAMTGPAN
jgi:hypothetical protein